MDLDEIFDEDGALTAAYLLARGYCCGLGCRNCPYVPRHGGEHSRPPEDSDFPSGDVSGREAPAS